MNRRQFVAITALATVGTNSIKADEKLLVITKTDEWNLSVKWSITKNFFLKYVDSEGRELLEYNKRGEYWQIIADVHRIPKDNPMPSAMEVLHVESEPLLLTNLTDEGMNKYIKKVLDECLTHRNKFVPCNKFPKLITVNYT